MPSEPDYNEIPQNAEAETNLIGSILISPDAWLAQPVPSVLARHFYSAANATIWETAQAMRGRGDSVDVVTLVDELARAGTLEQVGGQVYVSGLADHIPTWLNVGTYARIVMRNALRRLAISADAYGGFAASALHDNDDDFYARWVYTRTVLDQEFTQSALGQRYVFFHDDEVEALQPAAPILGQQLWSESVGILYAHSGRWKSYVALDWALCLATGTPWLGKRADGPMDVLYVAAEGGSGYGGRIKAWKAAHGVSGRTRLHLLLVPVELMDENAERDLLAGIYQRNLTPGLIVLDTLSACMDGGDDKDGADVAGAIRAAYRIRAEMGCCVLIVHHAGKDATRGLRGASELHNNVDFVHKIVAVKDDGTELPFNEPVHIGQICQLVNEKARNDAPAAMIRFTTKRQTWADAHGVIEGQLVIVPTMPEPADLPDPPTPFRPSHREPLP